MNRLTVGFGRGFPRAWLFPIGAITILLGVAVAGALSRSIAADFIAWWPVWIGLGVTAYLVRDRKLGAYRMAGLVPLAGLFFVALFTWGHLAGWGMMPSASQRLVGPESTGVTRAFMSAGIDGRILVSGDSEFLYRVEPIRRGGRIGIPTAAEQMVDSMIDVTLEEPADPGLYTYAGWDLALAPLPAWTLSLDGAVEADLRALTIEELTLGGAGTVVLGTPDGETPVTVAGGFRIVVPDATPVRVVGTASVPSSWVLTDEGAMTPGGGEGWLITVVGEGSLTVTTH
jgi:hypothetical protein